MRRRLAALAEVVASGMLTMGPKVRRLRGARSRTPAARRDAVVVSSGTAALHLALLALGIGPGDEVIVPAYTFPATANVVELCGAHAVLVDVDPETFNLDSRGVVDAVTPRTRAVLAVHLFGRPVDWEALQTAVPQEVALIEDAAGALGARYRGTPVRPLGLIGCLSFHPRKIVTTGEGGAVMTDDAELADAIRRLRHHGIVPRGEFDIPAARPQLPAPRPPVRDRHPAARAPRAPARQRGSGSPPATRSASSDLVLTPTAAEGDRHGWQAYVVQLDRRDEALRELRAEGIEAQIGTYALHHLGAYRDRGRSPAQTAPSPARLRCRSRRRRPRRNRAGWRRLWRGSSRRGLDKGLL